MPQFAAWVSYKAGYVKLKSLRALSVFSSFCSSFSLNEHWMKQRTTGVLTCSLRNKPFTNIAWLNSMTSRAHANNLRSGGPFSFFVPLQKGAWSQVNIKKRWYCQWRSWQPIKSSYNALTYSFKWEISHRHLKNRCYLRNYALWDCLKCPYLEIRVQVI